MSANDWADDGWRDFEDRMLEGDETKQQVRLLKAAWLAGAKAGVAKAQELLAESMPELAS